MASQILITMDDLETAVPLNAALEAGGFSTTMFSSLDDARGTVRRENPDLIILTGAVHEPHAQQLAALAHDAEISTFALLEPTDSERTERVERLHATEVMIKPVPADDAVATARRLIERRKLQERTGIVGESAAIQEVLVKIEQMAPVSSTVLIQGESGTGKELVAKALHDLSPRRGQAFITVNCAALPETLLESELFGHEKGAFTGAAERRLGRFELADGGTIFLDEIGEIPLSTQVKLLRVLESRNFFRVGGTQAIKVNVRVIAATNRTLRDAVALGEFRDDLYYRLNVLNIYLPPLRERRGDIPLLVRRFIREF
ncbi:MAG TPA: sigma-54 dependent transcriptional regulator, partial [Gemmatimonadales bacterium]